MADLKDNTVDLGDFGKMGLGDAVLLLIETEVSIRHRSLGDNSVLIPKREQIVAALNAYEIDLGMACDIDGDGDVDLDDLSLLQKNSDAAGCCRLVSLEPTVSRVSKPTSSRKKKTRGGSRKRG